MLEPVRSGEEVTAEWLNELRDLALRGSISADGGSGLAGYIGPNGAALYATKRPPRWARVLSGGTGGIYEMQEEIPSGPGAWDDGVVFTARSPNGATDLADGTFPSVLCHYNIASDEWTIETPRCV